jgi:gamma-tubulin complex component 5
MFHSWCAAKEAEICRAHAGIGPPLAVSLLSLENGLRCAFSESFSALLDVLRSVLTQTSRSRETTEVWMLTDMPARVPPAAVTCLLLDTLLHTVQTYSSMGDISTCNTLMRVFVHTAEPSWTMIGCWLKDGMPVRDANERRQNYGVSALDEFFIEDNEMTLIEAEFWADGYTLRGGFELGEEGNDQKATPTFLAQIAGALLASGKAIGLLRAMGVPPSVDGKAWLPNWPSFKTLLASYVACDRSVQCPPSPPSIDVLTRVVCDEVLPHCQATDTLLVNVIVDDCALLSHLSAIEDVFLMRKGDAMSQYSDALFAKVSKWSPSAHCGSPSNALMRTDGQSPTVDRFPLSQQRLCWRR